MELPEITLHVKNVVLKDINVAIFRSSFHRSSLSVPLAT